MVDKQPSLPRTTTSSSLIVLECDEDFSTYINNEQVICNSPASAPCTPWKTVIAFDVENGKQSIIDRSGFEVEDEKKSPPHGCISPRSILEASVALSTQDKEQDVMRLPHSGLGNFLAARGDNKKDVDLIMSFQKGSEPATGETCTSFGNHSNVTKCLSKKCILDRTQPDCLACIEGVTQNVDICPNVTGTLVPDVEDSKRNFGIDEAFGSLITERLEGCFINSYVLTREKNAQRIVSEDGIVDDTEPSIDSCTKDLMNAFHSTGLTEILLLRNGGCRGTYNSPYNARVNQQSNLVVKKCGFNSFFSTSSSIACQNQAEGYLAFLEECFLCKRSLHLGKDIYVYRGDQSFCSVACRYQKISFDARKAKCRRTRGT
ncbi:hypothetical protein KP509_02G110800 [Ceratopteris richardii]|uniref:FLZ-type domain-containing protein n=1 Tax=Ceratopteris richardii TaxID=49495 RepID=A0A8T2VH40_CERRI|nr:hypothetical protein KP509_02G110800 [Ceratopteris richardii]